MATHAQIEATYNYMDELWRLSLGDHADITCAFFDGRYDKSLEQAQADKYDWILSGTHFCSGERVLDIGCGWGGLLLAVRGRGGVGKGLTLSTRQAESCWRAGLDVEIRDWKELDAPAESFDVITSVGAFEHFCSKEEYLAGKQDEIYGRFFALCHRLLKPGRRMFLQTMTWGDRVPDPAAISLRAPEGSDANILGHVERFYPGSWLPSGLDQLRSAAAPWFSAECISNGREDYIATMARWGERVHGFAPRKVLATLRTARYLFTDRDFRHKWRSARKGYNQECFRRRLMDHYRIVFQRR